MIDDDEMTADAILSQGVKWTVPSAVDDGRTTVCEEVMGRHSEAEALHQANQARQRMFAIMAALLLIATSLMVAWWP